MTKYNNKYGNEKEEPETNRLSTAVHGNNSTSSLSAKPDSTDDLAPFNNDWMGRFHGRSTTVLKPKSTSEVSKILQWCNQRGIGVVPQGGNTGLVGGSVPINDELVLSLSNLNKVRSFDPVSGQFFPLVL